MSDEDFLKRWARRKQDVAKAEQAPAAPASEVAAKAPKSPEADKAEPQFDPASLPPIESITALSDVTAFLRDGVPAELNSCGASPRVDSRSRDPGLRRPCGKRLGLHRSERDAGLRSA